MEPQAEHGRQSRWHQFWDRGGWWKAVLFAAVYYAIYQLLGVLTNALFGRLVDKDDPYADGLSVFIELAVPILVTGIILLVVAISFGWLRELFGPQPIRGSRWMWIAVAIVVVFNVLRLVSTDYAHWDAGAVVAVLFAGLCIGFVEELVTRGFAVSLLRRAGYRERSVALLSSLIFAAMHAGNFFSGQNFLTTAITVVYTFAFGLVMYVALRVTGNLLWPMLLHASTDPSLILLVGGIDTTGGNLHPGPLAGIAGLANWAIILFGIVIIIVLRGQITPEKPGRTP